MTESRGAVDPPYAKRSVQLTIVAWVFVICCWQAVTLLRVTSHPSEDHRGPDAHGPDAHGPDAHAPDAHARGVAGRWGELSGVGHPLIEVDLNFAPLRELSLLPGVGPVLARRIVKNRERLGPFESLEDLARVHGIGVKTIVQIGRIGFVEQTPSRASPLGLERSR